MSSLSNETEPADAPYQRSHVVIASQESVHERPYLILTDETYPNHGEQYVAVSLGTDSSSDAIEIHPDEWEIGGLSETIYAYPSQLRTLRHDEIRSGIGALTHDLTNTISQEAANYLLD